MKQLIHALRSDESGQGLVEYVLIIALVSIGLFAVALLFRNAIGGTFDEITTKLNEAPASEYTPGG